MKRRKKILIILGIVLLLAGAAAWYIYKEYNRVHEDTADLKPDYSISATDLIKEFENNEKNSNEKYWNKVIEVNGMVKDVKPDDRGFYSVVLGDTSFMSSVRCSMDSIHNKEAAFIQKGKAAVMKGICTGFNADELLGSDVILVRSVVDSKK
jgi:tRNA_anti-like